MAQETVTQNDVQEIQAQEQATEGQQAAENGEQKPKAKRKVKRPEGKSPSVQEFLDVWETSTTKQQVVNRLVEQGFHMTYNAALQRESKYREKGIKMKEMPRAARQRLDVEALNKHIEEIHAKQAETSGEGEGQTEQASE